MKPLDKHYTSSGVVFNKKTKTYPNGNVIVEYNNPWVVTIRDLHRIRNGDNSPRVNGHLFIRANRFENSSKYSSVVPGISYASEWYWGAYIETYTPVVPPANPYSFFDYSRPKYDDALAISRLYDKLSETKAQMATTFAERQSTINTVADKLEKVFRAYRDVKRGNVNRAARRLGIKKGHKPRSKQAAGQWLELQYGWLPLVGDVYTMLNFNQPIRNIIYGVGRNSETLEYKKDIFAVSRFDVNVNYWCVVKYGASVHVSDPALAFGQRAGLINPSVVAWELMPFSFVIDWALPIGDYLDNLTATVGLAFSNPYRSHQCYIEVTAIQDKKILNRGSTPARYTGYARETYRNIVPFPSPSLSFKNPISPLHLANAIALGRQFK